MMQMVEFIGTKPQNDTDDYLQFICKLKSIIKSYLRENLDNAFAAKLVLREKYSIIDSLY